MNWYSCETYIDVSQMAPELSMMKTDYEYPAKKKNQHSSGRSIDSKVKHTFTLGRPSMVN